MANTEAPKERKQESRTRRGVKTSERINVVLPRPLVEELARLEELTGESRQEIMRWGIVLFARYARALEEGAEIRIVNPSTPGVQKVITLPIAVGSTAGSPT